MTIGKSSFSSDAALTTLSAVTGRGIALLVSILTTHIFDSAIFGLWLLVLTFANFFLPLTTARFEIPYVMAASRKAREGITALVVMFTLTIVCLITGFLLFSSPAVLRGLTGLTEDQRTLSLLTVPTLLILAGNLVTQAELMRRKAFVAIAISNLVTPGTALLLILTLPRYFGATATVAATIFLLSSFAGLSFPFLMQSIHLRAPRLNNFTRLYALSSLSRYKAYPKYSLPLSLSATSTERILQLVMVQSFSLGSLASFYVARQILNGVTSVVANSLRIAFFAHGANDRKIEVIRQRSLTTLKLLTYITIPVLAFGIFWCEALVRFFAGQKWDTLPEMAWYCMFPASVLVLSGPFDRIFDLMGKQRLSVLLQMVSDIAKVVVSLFAIYLDASLGTLVACITGALAVYNVVWLGFALRAVSTPYIEVWRVGWRAAALLGICCVLHWLVVVWLSQIGAFMAALILLALSLVPGLTSLIYTLFPRNRLLPGHMNKTFGYLP